MGYNACMDQQRRVLTGMTNGLPIDVPAPGAPAVIHTLDVGTAQDQNGRPYLDAVTLFVANGAAALAGIVTVTVGAITMNLSVPAGTIVNVFDETAFGGALAAAGGGGATITVVTEAGSASSAMVAWGWFTRT